MNGIDGITVDRLQEAGDTLDALGEAFGSISMFDEEGERERLQIMMMLSYTNMAVAELALHLVKGLEIHDALRAAVRGGLKIDSDVAARFQEDIENIMNPMKKN